jgi:hypothetical protein
LGAFIIISIIEFFTISKTDGYIDYSEFRQKIENGQIVYVEVGENVLRKK